MPTFQRAIARKRRVSAPPRYGTGAQSLAPHAAQTALEQIKTRDASWAPLWRQLERAPGGGAAYHERLFRLAAFDSSAARRIVRAGASSARACDRRMGRSLTKARIFDAPGLLPGRTTTFAAVDGGVLRRVRSSPPAFRNRARRSFATPGIRVRAGKLTVIPSLVAARDGKVVTSC